MPKTSISVVDIGSSNISVIIGQKGANNNFVVLGSGDSEYAGYYEGEFLEEEKLKDVFASAISEAEQSACQTVEKLFVGVPADFSVCDTKTVTQNYGQKTRITQEHLDYIFSQANTYQSNDYVLISCSPIAYVLDDGRKTLSPIGQKTSKITANLSFIYAERTFIEKINGLLKSIGIGVVEYLSASLCEATYLLERERREDVALIIDSGYITTSISLVKGDGLVAIRSFAVGGAHICADLSECLGISFKDAELLKKQLILSVRPGTEDNYEIVQKDSLITIPMNQANEIVFARLDYIAQLINKCLSGLKQEYPKMPYYITGGGFCYLKGAKEYISKTLGTNVTLLSPQDIHLQKPHYSSILGLLNTAIKQESQTKSLFKKILEKIRKG